MWQITMIHTCEMRELPNSAVFANIVVPSQWLHDVIAMTSRSRVAFLRVDHRSASCFLRIVFVRQTCPMPPMITKMTRLDKIPSRWHYEGKDEFNTNMNVRVVFGQFFSMSKVLEALTKYLPNLKKLNRWSYDGIRWHKMSSRIARWRCDEARI